MGLSGNLIAVRGLSCHGIDQKSREVSEKILSAKSSDFVFGVWGYTISYHASLHVILLNMLRVCATGKRVL